MLARYASWLSGDNALRSLFSPFDFAFSWPSELAAPAIDAGPKVDVLEKDGGVEFHCDVPGAGPEDVNVTMENGVLTLEARRTLDTANATVRYAERYHGTFARSFRLGDSYDPNQVSANLKNGVLVVHVAKRPQATPKKIPIGFGGAVANKQLGAAEETAPASA